MSLKKPKFWDYKKPNLFSYILLPLAYVLQILNTLKKLITSTKKYPEIKSICIGNIYLVRKISCLKIRFKKELNLFIKRLF